MSLEESIDVVPKELWLPPERVFDISKMPKGFLKSIVTPIEMGWQLRFGAFNPGYRQAEDNDDFLERLTAWRSAVMYTEYSEDGQRSPNQIGSHLTRALARIACHPDRLEPIDVRRVIKSEEFLTGERLDRNPAELLVVMTELRGRSNQYMEMAFDQLIGA